eukprot:COSAG04_NODE_361_length_15860_cov_18.114904_8_plen_200_part_00
MLLPNLSRIVAKGEAVRGAPRHVDGCRFGLHPRGGARAGLLHAHLREVRRHSRVQRRGGAQAASGWEPRSAAVRRRGYNRRALGRAGHAEPVVRDDMLGAERTLAMARKAPERGQEGRAAALSRSRKRSLGSDPAAGQSRPGWSWWTCSRPRPLARGRPAAAVFCAERTLGPPTSRGRPRAGRFGLRGTLQRHIVRSSS